MAESVTILNYSHPLTERQIEQIESLLTGQRYEQIGTLLTEQQREQIISLLSEQQFERMKLLLTEQRFEQMESIFTEQQLEQIGSHLTEQQIERIHSLIDTPVGEVFKLKCKFDHQVSFQKQLVELQSEIPFSSKELQTKPILLVPPALNFIAAMVISDLHGRMGYFPPIIRIRRVENSTPPRYEVAEIINLQDVRDSARDWRAAGEG